MSFVINKGGCGAICKQFRSKKYKEVHLQLDKWDDKQPHTPQGICKSVVTFILGAKGLGGVNLPNNRVVLAF